MASIFQQDRSVLQSCNTLSDSTLKDYAGDSKTKNATTGALKIGEFLAQTKHHFSGVMFNV